MRANCPLVSSAMCVWRAMASTGRSLAQPHQRRQAREKVASRPFGGTGRPELAQNTDSQSDRLQQVGHALSDHPISLPHGDTHPLHLQDTYGYENLVFTNNDFVVHPNYAIHMQSMLTDEPRYPPAPSTNPYPYTTHLLDLEGCQAAVIPVLCTTRDITTPLKAQYIVRGIQQGFHIGFDGHGRAMRPAQAGTCCQLW